MPDIYSLRKGTPAPPPGAVFVGRGSRWGNPYHMGEGGGADRARVCDAFEVYARERLAREPGWLDALRGKDLVCFCQFPGQSPRLRCHAETLIRLANQSDPHNSDPNKETTI